MLGRVSLKMPSSLRGVSQAWLRICLLLMSRANTLPGVRVVFQHQFLQQAIFQALCHSLVMKKPITKVPLERSSASELLIGVLLASMGWRSRLNPQERLSTGFSRYWLKPLQASWLSVRSLISVGSCCDPVAGLLIAPDSGDMPDLFDQAALTVVEQDEMQAGCPGCRRSGYCGIPGCAAQRR